MNAGIKDPINELRAYVSPSAWQNITVGSSIAAGATGAQCRLEGERVFLEGSLARTSGNFTVGDTIGTIPSGYRPARAQVCDSAEITSGRIRLAISTSGVITIGQILSGTPGTAYLDGLTYSTT
jgi:hypothetical protein